MGFSRQEYWSGLPFPSLGDLPDPGDLLCLLHWQVDSLPLASTGKPFLEAGPEKRIAVQVVYLGGEENIGIKEERDIDKKSCQ